MTLSQAKTTNQIAAYDRQEPGHYNFSEATSPHLFRDTVADILPCGSAVGVSGVRSDRGFIKWAPLPHAKGAVVAYYLNIRPAAEQNVAYFIRAGAAQRDKVTKVQAEVFDAFRSGGTTAAQSALHRVTEELNLSYWPEMKVVAETLGHRVVPE